MAEAGTFDESQILRTKWLEGFGLHVDGFVFGDGRVILCDCRKIKEGKTSATVASPIGESALGSILLYNEDPWVKLTELDGIEIAAQELRLSCGEGAMGNEGYVAASNLDSKELRWMAFFTCSNPFSNLRLEAGFVTADNTYDQEWVFPLDRPQDLKVLPC